MSFGTWARFEQDPRSPRGSRLRASDRDRDIALEVLGEAFADGRLDHGEYDTRSSAVTTAKVLGDLVPPLDDLVPDAPSTSLAVGDGRVPAEGDIHAQAVRRWEKDRREALTGFIGLSVLTWTIWAFVMLGGFPWPIFPMLAAGVNVLKTVMQKQDIIDEHVVDLRRREAKALRERESSRGAEDAAPEE